MTRNRLVVLGGVILGVLAYAGVRVDHARTACLGSGGIYEIASLTCSEKPRPIYLDRGIRRG